MTLALQPGASRPNRGRIVVSLALLGLSIPSLAFAADEASVLRARAAKLATAGDCAAALPLIEQAKAIDPAGDDTAALMTGRCLISQEKFVEAKPVLERAVAHDENSGEALLALGVAKYHLGEKDAARADLERARVSLPNNPEVELYLGMILLEEEQPAAAITRLDRSRGLYGDTFEPVSNYYAALAQVETGDEKEAEDSLRRVQQMAPGTIWAQRAGEALAQSEARRHAAVAGPARWVTLQGGLDFDSNISLRSDQISGSDDVTNDEDGRAWWGVDAGKELFRKNGWGGGVGGAYTGSQPFHEEDFDQNFISTSLWLDRELGSRTLLRISPEGGYAWFDGDEFLRFIGIRPELRHDFGDAGLGTFYVRYAYNDFLYEEIDDTLQISQVNRDGHDVLFGYDHQITVGESTMLRGGLFGRDYTAEAADYDFTGGGGWLGVRQVLPWRLILDVTGNVEYDNYEATSAFANPGEGERHDVVGSAGAVLTKPINEWLSVSARYQYLNNDSSTQLFNYDRHIAGAFVTIGLIR